MAHSAQSKRPEYEFLGPPGVTLMTIGLPFVLYALTFLCNDLSGCPVPATLSPSTLDWDTLKREAGWPGIWGLASWKATGWTLAYYLFSAVLYRVLPGEHKEGTVLSNGGRLKYRFNAFSSSIFTLVLCLAGTVRQGADFPVWTFITDNYLELLTANILVAWVLATYVYLKSFGVKQNNAELRELAAGGDTGNRIYDWFIGRELNPRITLPLLGEIDIKEFMELRPGMTGYLLVNCAHIAKQYRNFGVVTDSIIFISVVQAVYILDGQYMESAILSTMDITTDGFGFMLAFGDLVWVPFLYTQQTKYLSAFPVHLGPVYLTIMLAMLLTGYAIFRLANSQKNTFRTNPNDPSVAHLTYLETKSGSRLITSGWWGLVRHINYVGDWIQAWPYSAPTGIAGYTVLAAGTGAHGAFLRADGREIVQGEARGWGMIFTYFYVLYFAVLLVHRDLRDDEKCHKKYGADWEEYKRKVRWRLIPYVY